jgi:hypothetical protein
MQKYLNKFLVNKQIESVLFYRWYNVEKIKTDY